MTAATLARIRQSYDRLLPRMPEVTAQFYARLFDARPATRALFTRDLQHQGRHLTAALTLIVRNLSMLDALEPALHDLGAHHQSLGVRCDDYPAVRDAMLAALADVAGPSWTPDLADDWTHLLQLICNHMLRAPTGPARVR